MDIVEATDDALRGRTLAYGSGAGRHLPPHTFQLVESGVKLSPLTTSEEGPFERVLEDGIVDAAFAPCVLSDKAADVCPSHDFPVPGAIVRALPNGVVQPLPVVVRRHRSFFLV